MIRGICVSIIKCEIPLHVNSNHTCWRFCSLLIWFWYKSYKDSRKILQDLDIHRVILELKDVTNCLTISMPSWFDQCCLTCQSFASLTLPPQHSRIFCIKQMLFWLWLYHLSREFYLLLLLLWNLTHLIVPCKWFPQCKNCVFNIEG